MFYWVLSHRDINRAFKGYIWKLVNVIALAVSFVPGCYGWQGWAQSRSYEAAPAIILITWRLIERCVCGFLFGHSMCEGHSCPWRASCAPPAQGLGDSLLLSVVSPQFQLLSPQSRNLPWACCCQKRNRGPPSQPFPPTNLLDPWGTVVETQRKGSFQRREF